MRGHQRSAATSSPSGNESPHGSHGESRRRSLGGASPQLVDAIDVDAQGECSSAIVRCRLDDERQGQDVTKGKRTLIELWNPDRTSSVRVAGFTSA